MNFRARTSMPAAAKVTEELLKPAAHLVPEPARSRFAATLKAVEAAGQAELHEPLDRAEVETRDD